MPTEKIKLRINSTEWNRKRQSIDWNKKKPIDFICFRSLRRFTNVWWSDWNWKINQLKCQLIMIKGIKEWRDKVNWDNKVHAEYQMEMINKNDNILLFSWVGGAWTSGQSGSPPVETHLYKGRQSGISQQVIIVISTQKQNQSINQSINWVPSEKLIGVMELNPNSIKVNLKTLPNGK